MNNNQQYLKVAVAAAQAGGKIFKKYFGRPQRIKKKGGNKYNLVTAADMEIEKLIKKTISWRFPKHQILGEENGWGKQKENNYKWIIDPVDGTTNFIQGVPFCSISIALWDNFGPLVAVVFDPLHEKLYQAIRGKGAKMNGRAIRVSNIARLSDGFGGFGWNEAYNPSLLNATKLSSKIITSARKSRALASSTLQMAYVAEGVFDFFVVNAIKIWDFAASLLLISEAGGKVTDWQNKKPTMATANLIASNGKLHNQLLNKLKSPA